jgi:hypothetical protein
VDVHSQDTPLIRTRSVPHRPIDALSLIPVNALRFPARKLVAAEE